MVWFGVRNQLGFGADESEKLTLVGADKGEKSSLVGMVAGALGCATVSF